jgi:hypothetical protein
MGTEPGFSTRGDAGAHSLTAQDTTYLNELSQNCLRGSDVRSVLSVRKSTA